MNTPPPLPAPVALLYPHTSRAAMLYTGSQMEVYALAAIAAQAKQAPAVQPDGEWVWMTHPNRNGGRPIPVQKFTEDGVSFYRPFDFDANDLEWGKRDDKWKVVEAVQPVQPTPPGWKLVPLQATNAMVKEGAWHTKIKSEDDESDSGNDNEHYRSRGQALAVYMVMVEAAPEHGMGSPGAPSSSEGGAS